MKSCQCGKAACVKRAHISCVHRVLPAPSVSHPGTPAPRLPVVLCGSFIPSVQTPSIPGASTLARSKTAVDSTAHGTPDSQAEGSSDESPGPIKLADSLAAVESPTDPTDTN